MEISPGGLGASQISLQVPRQPLSCSCCDGLIYFFFSFLLPFCSSLGIAVAAGILPEIPPLPCVHIFPSHPIILAHLGRASNFRFMLEPPPHCPDTYDFKPVWAFFSTALLSWSETICRSSDLMEFLFLTTHTNPSTEPQLCPY